MTGSPWRESGGKRRGPAWRWLLVCAAALLAPAGAAALGLENFSAQLTLTTDYVFRGVSQTREDPAIQGGIDFEHGSGLFVGIWGSNVDFPTNQDRRQGRDLELDYYLGYAFDLAADWSAYATVVRYDYPGSDGAFEYDYNELNLAVQFRELASAGVAWTDDALGFGRQAIAWELSGRYPLPRDLDLVAGAGYYDLDELFGRGYSYWNLGLSRQIGSFIFDLGYYDTGDAGTALFGERAEARVVFSVSAVMEGSR